MSKNYQRKEKEILWKGLKDKPFPHIISYSQKKLHSWWAGPRECTAERILLNPYNGCFLSCPYCYTLAYRGKFALFRQTGLITVWPNYAKDIARQLDSINVVHCGYLSPVADPFQPLEDIYHLSEQLIREFVKRNIPIEFITKANLPDRILSLIKKQEHSFGQISILTLDESLNRHLCPGGASVTNLLQNIERMAIAGIFVVARIDPIIPYINDDLPSLEALVKTVVQAGAQHIVASCLDIPITRQRAVLDWLAQFKQADYQKFTSLYQEKKGFYLHAKTGYRRQLFDFLKRVCTKLGITFALCMEFDLSKPGQIKGLNSEYMTSHNCEGIDIPIYLRKNDSLFAPFDCLGNCLNCDSARCGIKDLTNVIKDGFQARQFTLQDYRRWSKEMSQSKLG
jgi:DNA repair photolyase